MNVKYGIMKKRMLTLFVDQSLTKFLLKYNGGRSFLY